MTHVPTVEQVRAWLTREGWRMTKRLHPHERWELDDDLLTEIFIADRRDDYASHVESWLTQIAFSTLGRYGGSESICHAIVSGGRAQGDRT